MEQTTGRPILDRSPRDSSPFVFPAYPHDDDDLADVSDHESCVGFHPSSEHSELEDRAELASVSSGRPIFSRVCNELLSSNLLYSSPFRSLQLSKDSLELPLPISTDLK